MNERKNNLDEGKQGQLPNQNNLQIQSTKKARIISLLPKDDYLDLLNALTSSLGFWDNPFDEVWNNV